MPGIFDWLNRPVNTASPDWARWNGLPFAPLGASAETLAPPPMSATRNTVAMIPRGGIQPTNYVYNPNTPTPTASMPGVDYGKYPYSSYQQYVTQAAQANQANAASPTPPTVGSNNAAAPYRAGSGTGSASEYDIPQGVDANWYAAFVAEHPYTIKTGANAGKTIYLTPEQVYERDGEYAIAHALADKAWGEQFQRTYNRPPSDYDWKASYYQRQRDFYNG